MDFLSLAKKRYACRSYKNRRSNRKNSTSFSKRGVWLPRVQTASRSASLSCARRRGWERLARCTRDFGAPVAIIVCADTTQAWIRKYDGKQVGDIDASIVTDHMMLCSTSLGLNTLWICMFKPEAVREEFGLPEGIEPVNILLIGYGDGEPASPDRHTETRKPLAETVVYEHL